MVPWATTTYHCTEIMNVMKLFRFLLSSAIVIMAIFDASAQLTWNIQVGGIWGKENEGYETGDYTRMSIREWDEEDYGRKSIHNGYEVSAGLYMQIPIKTNSMFIDTGLGWKLKNVVSVRDFVIHENPDYGDWGAHKLLNFQGNMNFLELPVRFGYQLNLNEKNSFQFKLGPYISYALGKIHKDTPEFFQENINGGIMDFNHTLSPISIGLSPAVIFKHRALSFGAIFNTPCFLNGPRAVKSSSFNLVLSVNLGSTAHWDWDAIADGLESASTIMQGITDTYVQTQSTYSDDGSSSSSTLTSSPSSNTSSQSNSSKTSDFDLSKWTARNAEKSTYDKYINIVIKILSGDDKTNRKADIQQKMRSIRTKWAKLGDKWGWPASEYETK